MLVGNIVSDEQNVPAAFAPQSTCDVVRTILQLLHCLQYPLTFVLGDVSIVVEYIGNDRFRHACQASYVLAGSGLAQCAGRHGMHLII